MTKNILDNSIIDSPVISPNSPSYRARSAHVKAIATAHDNVIISEPSSKTMSDPQYNKVTILPDGGTIELDSSPGAERMAITHKDGHFIEISKDHKVTKIFGKDFEIILDDKTLSVSGNLNITVQGDCNLLVAGDAITKIQGNQETRIAGNSTTYVKGEYNIVCEKDIQVETLKNYNLKIRENMLQSVTGKYDIIAKGNIQIEGLGNISTKSSGITNFYAISNLYVDSSVRVDLNLPHAAPASHKNAISKDIKFGLGFADSLIEPSATELFLNKAEASSALLLRDNSIKYPKDRTKL